MVLIKCGTCKLSFKVEDKYLVTSIPRKCPNCGNDIPYKVTEMAADLVKENSQSESKAYVLSDAMLKDVDSLPGY